MFKLSYSRWILWLLIAGCGNAHQVDSATAQRQAAELKSALADPAHIDFAQVTRLVIAPNCLGCHSAAAHKDGVDLSSYASVIGGKGDRTFVEAFNPGASPMYSVLAANGARHMPPMDHPQLSADQITLVYDWIENGAQAAGGTVAPKPTPLKDQLQPYFDHPEMLDYAAITKFVLGPYCVKCHSQTGDSPKQHAIEKSDMSTYASSLPSLVAGQPEKSKVFVSTAINQSMPPAKKGYDPLDGLRLKVLRLWLLNCAVETKPVDETLIKDPKHPGKVRNCSSPSP